MRKLPKLEYPIKLDLGCGKNKIDDFIGLDRTDYGQEIVWDINHGLPLPDKSVIELHSSHFIEHLKEEEIANFIQELIRVCARGAKITLICPHKDCPEAYFVCHHSLWCEARIRGIADEFKNHGLVLREARREGINLIMNLTIK